MTLLNGIGLSLTVAGACLWLGAATPAAAQDDNTQVSELCKLQAAYHRAASVRDPVNGDSLETVTGRVRDVLSLFTADAVLYLHVGGARDGYYLGNGDPDDASTCPAPSSDPNNRGSLCTFYKYVSGPFQAANKFVGLTPSYKEFFDPHGNAATVYFECHYFNVATDPGTGSHSGLQRAMRTSTARRGKSTAAGGFLTQMLAFRRSRFREDVA